MRKHNGGKNKARKFKNAITNEIIDKNGYLVGYKKGNKIYNKQKTHIGYLEDDLCVNDSKETFDGKPLFFRFHNIKEHGAKIYDVMENIFMIGGSADLAFFD